MAAVDFPTRTAAIAEMKHIYTRLAGMGAEMLCPYTTGDTFYFYRGDDLFFLKWVPSKVGMRFALYSVHDNGSVEHYIGSYQEEEDLLEELVQQQNTKTKSANKK